MAAFPDPVDVSPGGDVAATFCATLVDEWARAGVTHALVAPGSRSTPMLLALAADARITVHVHHDERAAAFAAVGIGLASGRPALVVTTSGTAAVELHPAMVEAHQAGVPVIAVTADRPPELHGVGAPQTVDQQHLFGSAVRWFVDPGVPDIASIGSWRSLAARMVSEAVHGPFGPGPVHVNLPFREPLVGAPFKLPAGRGDGAPWHTAGGHRVSVRRDGAERLGQLLDTDRGLIVVGAGGGSPDLVLDLARATGWPVLADPRSGCRLPDETVVAAADAILRDGKAADRLRPDAVLRLGEPFASKVVGQWLAEVTGPQVAVHAHGRWFDPDHASAYVLHADPDAALTALARLVRREPSAEWTDAWKVAEKAAQTAIDATLATWSEPTEPAIARSVFASLPAASVLVVSSSMPIRDLEWYARPRLGARVLANRGANGIDGVVSTAIGVALSAKGSSEPEPTVALVGDVAFLHDSSALIGAAQRGIDLTLVVIDNDGGGIFSFLPQAAALTPEKFETFYGTPHGVDLAVFAAAHGLVTVTPVGSEDVAPAVQASIAAGGVRLVRVHTDRATNVEVHDAIHAAVAQAVDAARTR